MVFTFYVAGVKGVWGGVKDGLKCEEIFVGTISLDIHTQLKSLIMPTIHFVLKLKPQPKSFWHLDLILLSISSRCGVIVRINRMLCLILGFI